MPLQLRYFYGGEADQFNFYRIPKALFTDRRFGKLSMEAKVLYGLLLDRNDTERNDTECSDTDLSIYPQPLSLPDRSQGQYGSDQMDRMDGFKEQVKCNIEYDRLLRERPCDAEVINGYVELMMDACYGSKATVRICRDEIPVAMVRKRFLMLT